MKKKIALFIALSLIILNIRIVCQPDFDHYVIGNNLDNTCIIFGLEKGEYYGIHTVWIHNTCFIPAPQELYNNI